MRIAAAILVLMGWLSTTVPLARAEEPAAALTGSPVAAATPPATRILVLRANSLIPLRFVETVASDTSKPGSNFRMEVTDDINVDDAVVIRAGSIAIGEVIHAQPAGAFGKAGELIVSARYVLVGEREVKLRSNLGSSGQSELGAAFLVPFVHGKQASIATDAEVVAKIAKDESFELPVITSR
jgi:hypothetical protein